MAREDYTQTIRHVSRVGLLRCRILLMMFSLSSCCSLGQLVYSQPPSRSTKSAEAFEALFGDGGDEDIDPNEHPSARKLDLPEEFEEVATEPTADELKQMSDWVRWLVLRNLPPNFEDNRKWGKHKEVWDGVHMHRDGLRLDTKRKWKTVKHGTWSRYYIEFIDPANRLEIHIQRFDTSKPGMIFIKTQIIAPLKLFGRVSEWKRDVQLISVSTNAEATVEMNVECEVLVRTNPLKLPPDVEFVPKVTDARISLLDFKTQSISQIHGPPAELLGRGIREVLDSKLEDYRDKLVQKMNHEIAKQQGKLRLSVQDWIQTSVQKKVKQ